MARFTKISGSLAVAAAQQRADYVVRGLVCAANTTPLAGYTVRLANKGIARETALGQTITDASGGYQIYYSPPQSGRRERGADVIVRVFAPGGGSAPLAQSEAIYNVAPDVTVNLTVPAGRASHRKKL